MSLRDQPDQFKVGSSLPFNARLPFRWCLSLSLLSLALAGFGLTWLQPMIPLLYSVTNTSLQLVSRWWILVFPGLAVLFALIHLILVRVLRDWAEIIIRLIAWSCVVLEIILLLIQIRLLWVLG
ncbi:MAG TPA: hypothetical protein DEP87_02950 [Candidatus Pacebacteria bacterium]|nr:hypothetical protein [Candidatus Paceibacterota bacterium]